MKKYVFSSLLFVLMATLASAQCAPTCTGSNCIKSSTDCQAVCTQTCTSSCIRSQALAGSSWQGQVEINDKKYAATGKIFHTSKGIMAQLSIADLKITDELFAVAKSKNKNYSFTPKNNLGFVALTKDYKAGEGQIQ